MYDDEPTMMGQDRPAANLVVRQGPQAGMSFPLSGGQMVIGREEGMTIVLQDPEASRRHARITWQEGQYAIEDLGSTNGTFVNGVQITTPKVLNPGDSIGIGQTALVFQSAGVQMGPVQPTPQQAPVYTPPPDAPTTSQASKATQYILYGCGCILLLGICFILTVVAWVFIDPQSFNNIMGTNFPTAAIMLPTYLTTLRIL